MNNLWQFKKFFLYSVLLHLFFASVLFLNFYKLFFADQQKISNRNDQLIINTYLYKSARLKKVNKNSSLKPKIIKTKTKINKIKIRNKTGITSDTNRFNKFMSKEIDLATGVGQKQWQKQKSNFADKNDKLLIMLHNLIERRIQYPRGILSSNNAQRKVKLGFTLYPDGHIENVTILQASGTEILDKSAINSLQMLQPVRIAGFYLKQEKHFSVTVIFRI